MSRPRMIHAAAPPERLAALRIVVGVFALTYLVARLPVFLRLRDRAADDLEPVGLLVWVDRPFDDAVVTAVIVVALLAGVGFVAGWRFRSTGPLFAATVLALTTYRSSWGQLLHFENLVVLHLLIVGFAASADAWSVDARRRAERAVGGRRDAEYAAPMRLACLVVVVAYVIAGFAKLRYGGVEWIAGDTLRNHIAYSAARLDLLGGTPSPLARPVIEQGWVLPPMAAAAVAVELAAPIALLGGRVRTAWVASAWVMHLAIAALMLVAFPYPLFLVAFAPFFDLERIVERVRPTRQVGSRRH